MQESLPPSRLVVARSARNITIAPTRDIDPNFANDTHVILLLQYLSLGF